MARHARGLYEKLIAEALGPELQALEGQLHVERVRPEPAEIADRVALHLSSVIERELRA